MNKLNSVLNNRLFVRQSKMTSNHFIIKNRSGVHITKKRVPTLISANKINKQRKTVKFLKLKCTLLYAYPLVNLIFFGRNTVNNFPVNLFIYQFFAIPTLYIYKSTFLVVSFYIYLIAGVIFNRTMNPTIRYHGILSNFLDITLLCFMMGKGVIPPYFKWSIVQPIWDSLIYTLYCGCTFYCLSFAIRGKTPTFPKYFQNAIKEILGQ